MKTILKSIAAFALVALMFSSCVKTRTCTCKDATGAVTSTATFKTSKSAATTLCTNYAFSGETCTLK